MEKEFDCYYSYNRDICVKDFFDRFGLNWFTKSQFTRCFQNRSRLQRLDILNNFVEVGILEEKREEKKNSKKKSVMYKLKHRYLKNDFKKKI